MKTDREIIEKLIAAASTAIPCLEDWMRSTGYGEVHRRDEASRDDINKAIAEATAHLDATPRIPGPITLEFATNLYDALRCKHGTGVGEECRECLAELGVFLEVK